MYDVCIYSAPCSYYPYICKYISPPTCGWFLCCDLCYTYIFIYIISYIYILHIYIIYIMYMCRRYLCWECYQRQW